MARHDYNTGPGWIVHFDGGVDTPQWYNTAGESVNYADHPLAHKTTPASISTAGAVTLTAAQLLGGIIVRDPNGAGRTDTLPTAALLVAACPGAVVGTTVQCVIINGADAAEAITIQEGTGGTWDANFGAAKTIAQNTTKTVRLRLTNVTAGAEAYVIYL